MIGWFRRACCAVVVMQCLSGGVAAQDFDTVLKQAVSDANVVYADPRVFARVSGFVALEFQLKSAALGQDFGDDSQAYKLNQIITVDDLEPRLWGEVYQRVFIERVLQGQDVNWNDKAAPITDQLKGSYEEHFNRHMSFLKEMLTSTEFPEAVTDDVVKAIHSAILTTALIYREYRQGKQEDDEQIALFIDCIFWPFCF